MGNAVGVTKRTLKIQGSFLLLKNDKKNLHLLLTRILVSAILRFDKDSCHYDKKMCHQKRNQLIGFFISSNDISMENDKKWEDI